MSARHATATKRDCPRDPHLALQPVKGERQEDGKYHSLVEAEPQGGPAGPQQLVGVRVGHAGRAAAVDGADHVALAHPLRGRAATWIHLQHVTLFSLFFFQNGTATRSGLAIARTRSALNRRNLSISLEKQGHINRQGIRQ